MSALPLLITYPFQKGLVEAYKMVGLPRVLNRDEESLTRTLEKREYWILGLFTGVFLLTTVFLSGRKLMWNDELYTYYMCRLPGLSEIWSALLSGGEQLPPFYYVITRLFTSTLGDESSLSYRLPSMLGFWAMCLCLYKFVRAKTSVISGLMAATFPLITSAYYYAYEARPYGLVLGFAGIAVLSWQSIIGAGRGGGGEEEEGVGKRRRRISLVALALSLAAAISNHYYAVLILLPFIFAESMRSLMLTRRRVDFGVWAALAVSAAPLFVFLPLIQSARSYAGTFWAPVRWTSLPDFYFTLLAPAVIPLIALIFLAGCAPRRDDEEDDGGVAQDDGDIRVTTRGRLAESEVKDAFASAGAAGRRPPPPPSSSLPEVLLALGFALIPVAGVVMAKLVTKGFTDRYVIAAVIGVSILVAFSTHKLLKGCTACAIALIICCGGWFGLRQYRTYNSYKQKGPIANQVSKLRREAGTSLPIVISDPHTVVVLARYAPPEIARSMVYLADPAASKRHLGFDSVDRGMLETVRPWFGINVEEYKTFIARQNQFVVYGNLGFLSWLIKQLKAEGWSIEFKDKSGENFLFLVSRQSGAPANVGADHQTYESQIP